MSKGSARSVENRTTMADALKAKSHRRRKAAEQMGEIPSGPPKRNDLTPQFILRDWRIDELKPPGRQVRRPSDAQARRIAASISELGYSAPVIVNEKGMILDGVARVAACRLQGIETIKCVELRHLTKQQERLLRISINRLQERGDWNLDELRLEFEELILEDAPIEITGFDMSEVDHIVQDDEAGALEPGPLEPSADLPPISRLGDVFALGLHRVICGDATSEDVWRRLGEGAGLATFVLTDQPYNVKIRGNVSSDQRHREFAMASGEMTDEQFYSFSLAWMEQALPFLCDGGVLGTFIDWRGQAVVTAAARRLKLKQLNLVVWAKTNAGMGSLYRSQHELLPLFKMGNAPHVNNIKLGRKGRWRSNVWLYPGASSLGSDARKGLQDHPTVKPVAMLQDAMLDLTNRGDLVIDPFLGSGSTLIAAEQTGRRCHGVELDPLYIDVVIRRWEALTGRRAELLSGADSDGPGSRRAPRGGRRRRGNKALLLPPPALA